eukprot:Rhum_TRINITY_DN11496_c0_g1::Rhum_TRINITY_DN11496_c0_g1_i1::g.44938::m.44938
MDALEQCLAGTVQELQALERLLAEPGEGTAHADLGQHVQSYVSGLGRIKDAVTRVDPTLTELVVPIHMMDVVDKGLPAQDSTATLQKTHTLMSKAIPPKHAAVSAYAEKLEGLLDAHSPTD